MIFIPAIEEIVFNSINKMLKNEKRIILQL